MKLSKLWMILSIVIIVILSILTDSSWIQTIAAVTGVIYVFGTALENKYGQLIGMVNSIMYGYIMFQNRVFGTALYDIVYCMPMQLYTFFTWGKKKDGSNKTEVSNYSVRHRIIIFVALFLVILIYTMVASSFKVNFALVDGISIILGVVALYMTAKKKIEQWHLFIISNIAMLVMWSIKCIENISNVPMLIMWVIYLINNSYGLYVWNKKIKDESVKNDSKKEQNIVV